MPYILTNHNLKEKHYHCKRQHSKHPKDKGCKYVFIDRQNGRFHIESSYRDIFTMPLPMMMWWFVNYNERDRMPYNRQVEETLHDMPEAYNAVVRIKLEPYQPTKADKLLQQVNLQRSVIKHTAFGVVDKPSVVSAVMPLGHQRSSLEITDWLQYLALPNGNTLYLLHQPQLLTI
ncbi:hypothetical protein [Geminocystis sp. NIES-3709]|uniref:hypothetical protein n=1 Tax=Geminocystis sp. NIES-3709 TaxID=1617448 RepID=UPI0005FC87D3|nr:hypothetical protein [Geminocystis sp. NIES-3709]BAQ67101.1 hypothetical protein GM3709_3866 [Geminocystis sp. NIES-3709]